MIVNTINPQVFNVGMVSGGAAVLGSRVGVTVGVEVTVGVKVIVGVRVIVGVDVGVGEGPIVAVGVGV